MRGTEENGIVPLLVDKMVNSKDLGRNGVLSASVLINGRMIKSRSFGALARLANGVEKISIFETIGGPPQDECSTSGQQDDGRNPWRAIERCVAASIKGFIIGSGLRGGLALFGIITRLRKSTSSARYSCYCQDVAAAQVSSLDCFDLLLVVLECRAPGV
jgi:hypothetical protein